MPYLLYLFFLSFSLHYFLLCSKHKYWQCRRRPLLYLGMHASLLQPDCIESKLAASLLIFVRLLQLHQLKFARLELLIFYLVFITFLFSSFQEVIVYTANLSASEFYRVKVVFSQPVPLLFSWLQSFPFHIEHDFVNVIEPITIISFF